MADGPSSAISKSYSSLKMTRNDCRGPSSSSTISNVPRRLGKTAGASLSIGSAFTAIVNQGSSGHFRWFKCSPALAGLKQKNHFHGRISPVYPGFEQLQCLPGGDLLEFFPLEMVQLMLDQD